MVSYPRLNEYDENVLTKDVIAWFLTQSIIVYSIGIELFLHLHKNGASETDTIIACLIVCVLTIIPSAEVFYRLVEIPSQKFAKGV